MSEFNDERLRAIFTNNHDDPGSFPVSPAAPTYRLPQIGDIVRLYRMHQELVERTGPKTRRILRVLDEFHGDAPEYIKIRVLQAEYRRQAENGYLRLDASEENWCPTLSGGFRMVWKELWPIKPIRVALVRSRGRQLEQNLGV
jgi:hypothetical protein